MYQKSNIFSAEMIDHFAKSEDWGAGNFVHYLWANIEDEYLAIELDTPYILPCGLRTLTLTLSQIIKAVDSWGAFYEDLGVEPKDPIAIYLDDSVHYFIQYLALNRIGAIPVCINGDLSPDIVAEFVDFVGVKRVITSSLMWKKLVSTFSTNDISYQAIKLDEEVISVRKPSREYQHHSEDPVLLGHTSGTTGTPKAVQFNHYGFSIGVKRELRKQVGKRILNVLPHSHAAAISIMMSGLMRGALIRIQTDKTSSGILNTIEKFRPDLFVSFSKVYVDLCRLDLSGVDLSSIGYWLSTGDANHEPHIQKLISFGNHYHKGKDIPGSIFIDNLGSSEFGFAAFRNIYRPGDRNFNRCIGKPFDWVTAAILDDSGYVLPPDNIGYLGVKSDSVTSGYWNDSLLTEKNRLNGFWLTGDLAYRSSDGIYYHVDRISDKIETEAGTLYSCQAEEYLLNQFPEIFDCSIVGVTDGGDAVKPLITVELQSETPKDSLLARINNALQKKGWPCISELILESANLHLGVTGKKLKRVLREVVTLEPSHHYEK